MAVLILMVMMMMLMMMMMMMMTMMITLTLIIIIIIIIIIAIKNIRICSHHHLSHHHCHHRPEATGLVLGRGEVAAISFCRIRCPLSGLGSSGCIRVLGFGFESNALWSRVEASGLSASFNA